jgi:hypothetical protein
MKRSQIIVLSIVWFVGIALLSVTFWVAIVQPGIDAYIQGVRRPPLQVYFRFPNNTAIPQYGSVDNYHTQITFQLPPKSHTQFTYHILNMGAADPLENVTLYFDSVSEKLALLGLANQSYPLPFRIDVGTININLGKDYGAIIETPSEAGTYDMQWHITSNELSYSFRVIIRVSE